MFEFISKTIKFKDLFKDSLFDTALLDNNVNQIEEIYQFLNNNKKLMIVNGFQGTGKTAVTDFILTNLNENILTIKYLCFETTILDDMLLSFFEDFRNYTIQGKIPQNRTKTDNFTQKINNYFNLITNPIVIVINSFDSILKDNKQEIINFLKHLTTFANIKIIITSRVFNYDDFSDIDYDRITTLALSKENFEKLLRANDIKNIGIFSDELYTQTKGYYHYVNLAVRLMKIRNLTLPKFLEVYSKSLMSFSDFILRDAVSLIDPMSLHLFRLLAIMRIPIHINLLKVLHLFNEERLYYYVSNSILSATGEYVYLTDYFREVIEQQIQGNVVTKLHRSCIDLYKTQLPLKPLERDLKLSRQTMRNEIEYHSLFIPKVPMINLIDNKIIPDEEPKVSLEQTTNPTEETVQAKSVEETKEEKLEKINFIVGDDVLWDNIADSIKDFVEQNDKTNEFINQNDSLKLTQLLNAAKGEEAKYNYKYAIILYQNALTKKDDPNFYQFLPKIYINLAKVYKHLSQWYEALEYYTKAQDYYYNVTDISKVCEVKYEIASVYFLIYKQDNAKYILSELEKSKDLTPELRIKVNIALAKVANDIDAEYEYYDKSMTLIEPGMDKSLLSELYYKFAEVNDDKGIIKIAAMFYKKCIDVDPSNPSVNPYLSQALSNLAQLYDENGNRNQAIRYYNESIIIDDITKNYNGLYCSNRHLAEIYSSLDENKSKEYLLEAFKCAKEINEPYYISDISLEIGNFFMLRKDYERAYEYLIQAYKIAKQSTVNDITDTILARVEYLKKCVRPEKLQEYQEKYGK